MSKEFEYTWKMATFTAIVLALGSCLVFLINSSGVKNASWDNFTMVVIPSLVVISFSPFPIQNIISKIKRRK